MNPVETMGEYLVKLSADIDTNSFNSAMAALNQLMNALKNIKGLAAAAAAVTGFAAIGKAAIDTIKSVAAADMQFKRLANQMWITKDSAKALSTAMKVMGVSEEDLAWIPELREQFFRLRSEMNQLATPIDADRQLKWIREIGYDIQSLQVKLKMLKEWVAYYLIKYLQPFIKEFQQFIQWLNDKLGKNMPQIAKKIAEFLGHVVSVGLSALKVLKSVIGTVYRFIDGLPANVKKWGAIFGAVGAFIMAGPFGKFLIAIGGALLLLEDFVYYMNGWKSSKTLAPVWEKLLNFLEGDTLSTISDSIKEILKVIADYLDYIVTKFVEGIDWDGILESWSDGLSELKDGVGDLFDAISDLFDTITKNTDEKAKSRQRSFWTSIGEFISWALKDLGRMAGMVGKLIASIALCLRGDFVGAAKLLGVVVQSAAKNSPWGRILSGVFESSADEKANTADAMNILTKDGGFTKEGAAAAIGNFSAESNVDPNNVQKGSQEEKEIYLRRLLNGDMSREEFVNDGVGFGLAQWTDAGRKGALYDFAIEQGRPINDLRLQLAFFMKELEEDYGDLYQEMKTTDDVDSMTRRLLHEYESPEDQGYGVQVDRVDRAQNAYDNNFVSTSSFAVNPTSYAATGGAGSNGFVQTGYSNGGSSISFGDIHVNVTNSNASARDIGNAVADAISTRYQRGVLV